MAVRRIVKGNLVPDPGLFGTGSTTLGNTFLNSSNTWATNATGTGAITVAEFARFNGRNCLHVVANGNAGAVRGFTTINQYVGGTITSAAVPYLIPIVPGRSYTVSVDFWLVGGGTNVRAELAHRSYSPTLTRIRSSAVASTTTDQWVTQNLTFTANGDETYYTPAMFLSQQTATTWSGEMYVSNIQFIDNTAPARTPATRTLITQPRVAVRDMGTALRFDGVDTTEVLTPTLPVLTAFTVSSWIVPHKIETNQVGVFCHSTGPGQNRWNLTVEPASNQYRPLVQFRSAVSFTKSFTITNQNLRFTANQKCFVSLTYDGAGFGLYINGVLDRYYTDADSPGITFEAAAYKIGNDSWNPIPRTLTGIIDEPRIWNRALTAQEVADLYYSNIVPRNGLVGEWLFNEGSGTIAIDSSGNGNNGTITGATYTTDVPLRIRTPI